MEWTLQVFRVIQTLSRQGWAQSRIANLYGIHQSTLQKACKRHNVSLQRNYVSGASCHNFNGYRTHDTRGCPKIKVEGQYIREHRLVAARILGRPPRPEELVHHINGNVIDNRPENIQIASRSQHMRIHPEIGMATRFGGPNDSR